MGDHDDGDALPVKLGDDFIHLRRCFGVQTGDRLIQQQAFPGGAQCPGQEHPLLLPAGEIPVAFSGELCHAHPLQILRCQRFFRFGVEGPQAAPALEARKHDLLHGCGEIPLHLGLLGQIADFGGF